MVVCAEFTVFTIWWFRRCTCSLQIGMIRFTKFGVLIAHHHVAMNHRVLQHIQVALLDASINAHGSDDHCGLAVALQIVSITRGIGPNPRARVGP